MTLDDLRALADKFFEWPQGSGRQTVTTFSALLFAQHVLQLREKSLGAENSAGMDALRDAAQRQLDALGGYRREIGLLTGVPDEQPCDAEVAARAALEQKAEPVATFAENATTQQQIEQTPPSEYRRGYWAGWFAIGKREGRIEAEDALEQQALARTVMLDRRGSDTDWEHTARLLDAALQELVVFVDERWGDNECRPLENAKHALGLVKDEE